jgi:hypothetical protein
MYRVIEIIIGISLLYSGLTHANAPYYFTGSMAAYGLLPFSLLAFVPFILPYFMIVIGCCLLLRFHEPIALLSAVTLLAIFFAAQLIAWISGSEISCGCFGHSNRPISASSIAFPAFLCVTGIVAMVGNSNQICRKVATGEI